MNKSPCIISSYSTIPSFMRPPAGRAGKRGSSHSINADLIHYVTEQGDSRSSLRTVGNDGRGQGDSRSSLRYVGKDCLGEDELFQQEAKIGSMVQLIKVDAFFENPGFSVSKEFHVISFNPEHRAFP